MFFFIHPFILLVLTSISAEARLTQPNFEKSIFDCKILFIFNCCCCCFSSFLLSNARDQNRTGMTIQSADFKSAVYAYSTTRALNFGIEKS